jgi:hypothetical protein
LIKSLSFRIGQWRCDGSFVNALDFILQEIREHKAARSAQPCISQPIGAYCVPQEVHQGGNEVPLQPGGHCLQGIISATSCIVADLAAKESITEARGSALNDEVVADGAAMAMAADAPHDEIAYYSTERPPVQQQEPQHTPTTAAAAATQVEQPPNEANSLPKGASASCSSTEVTGEQAAETSASTETSGGIGIAGLRLPHRTNLKQLLDLQGMHDLQPYALHHATASTCLNPQKLLEQIIKRPDTLRCECPIEWLIAVGVCPCHHHQILLEALQRFSVPQPMVPLHRPHRS